MGWDIHVAGLLQPYECNHIYKPFKSTGHFLGDQSLQSVLALEVVMGIPKLHTYMKSKYDGWRDLPLEGPVVLDGLRLIYILTAAREDKDDLEICGNLYKKVNLEWTFGGQYAALRDSLEHFFDVLTQNHVGPIHVVLDGLNPKDKLETIKSRKQDIQDFIITEIKKNVALQEQPSQKTQNVHSPLVIEMFRKFLEDYNRSHGNLKVYSADGELEADSLGMVIANNLNCPLLGEDSDYYISSLTHGYIPYSKLTWSGAGSPVTGKAYYRVYFAESLKIEPELVVAIPALVGNDSIPNLVESTSLKRVRDKPYNRGNDTEKGILLITQQKSLSSLERNIESNDGGHVLRKFRDNLQKAREMYEEFKVFDEVVFRKVCSYRPKTGGHFPSWMIEQYRDFKLSKNFFEVSVKGDYFHRVIPDDYRQQSAKIFSRPIRQEMFGIMEVREDVREVVRKRDQLVVQLVRPKSSELSIYKMDEVPVETKIRKLCDVSMCNSATLSSLDLQWYVAIASVCYWAKTARISKYDLKLKALLLCFAECFLQDTTSFDPTFDVQNLHYLTQWQCTYYDCILLNQILGLPLPYLSPAYLFDGKRVSHYYRQSDRYLEGRLVEATPHIQSLYEKLLGAVQQNL